MKHATPGMAEATKERPLESQQRVVTTDSESVNRGDDDICDLCANFPWEELCKPIEKENWTRPRWYDTPRVEAGMCLHNELGVHHTDEPNNSRLAGKFNVPHMSLSKVHSRNKWNLRSTFHTTTVEQTLGIYTTGQRMEFHDREPIGEQPTTSNY
jgi:hypothetical protein